MAASEPPRRSGYDPATPEPLGFGYRLWSQPMAVGSQQRISGADTVQKANAQATTEAVVLLHSIRRIMIWMLVIVPITAAVLGGLIVAAVVSSDPVMY